MELIAMLTLAKEAGFETGQILSTVIIYALLSRKFDKLIQAISTRVEVIEDHVGIKKKP